MDGHPPPDPLTSWIWIILSLLQLGRIFTFYMSAYDAPWPFHWVSVFVALWLVSFSWAVRFYSIFGTIRHQSRSNRRGYIFRCHFRASIAKLPQFVILLQIHRWRLRHLGVRCQFITSLSGPSYLHTYFTTTAEHEAVRSKISISAKIWHFIWPLAEMPR